MNWRPRLAWGTLAAIVAIVAWLLTLWITHVNRAAHFLVDISVDERPPVRLNAANLTLGTFQSVRFRLPRVVFRSYENVLLVITPATHSITVSNVDPMSISCGFSNRIFKSISVPFLVEAAEQASLTPLALTTTGPQTFVIRVPDALRAALESTPDAQGLISCASSRELSAKPTFTERSVTIDAKNGGYGSVLFDVSALEDVDNLRFSGGVSLPLFGDRTRLLDNSNDVVSAEWVDVTAEEHRDIILVIIGALAAIAAAMAIEAIRPFIEKEEQRMEQDIEKLDAHAGR